MIVQDRDGDTWMVKLAAYMDIDMRAEDLKGNPIDIMDWEPICSYLMDWEYTRKYLGLPAGMAIPKMIF